MPGQPLQLYQDDRIIKTIHVLGDTHNSYCSRLCHLWGGENAQIGNVSHQVDTDHSAHGDHDSAGQISDGSKTQIMKNISPDFPCLMPSQP